MGYKGEHSTSCVPTSSARSEEHQWHRSPQSSAAGVCPFACLHYHPPCPLGGLVSALTTFSTHLQNDSGIYKRHQCSISTFIHTSSTRTHDKRFLTLKTLKNSDQMGKVEENKRRRKAEHVSYLLSESSSELSSGISWFKASCDTFPGLLEADWL